MWSTIELLGIFLVLLTRHQTSGQDNICPNTQEEGRSCISLKSCKLLFDYLDTKDGRKNVQILGKSLCARVDSNDRVFKVCCPNEFNSSNVNNNNKIPSTNISSNDRQPTTKNYGPLYPPVCGYTDVEYPRVVNGVPADLGAWPWATLLGYRTKNPSKPNYLCGGALISARHVLTAGHCVYRRNDLYLVRVGDLDIEDDYDGATPMNLLIERKTVHPQFNAKYLSNDIAILRVNGDIQFTDLIKPICLPVSKNIQSADLTNTWPFIVGWGELGYKSVAAAALQQVQLPIVEESECKIAYNGRGVFIDDRVLCAGLIYGGQDSCRGDSGGPMMYAIDKTWYSIGVISFGVKCALPGYPSVYTKTQYFLDFILEHLN